MTPSLAKDIQYILHHPWEVTAWEFDLNLKDNLSKTIPFLESKVNEAIHGGILQIWKTEEGIPISILICYPIAPNQYETIFLSSDEMTRHGLMVTKALKELLREKVASLSGEFYCRSFSSSNHPKVIRWFEFIGFTYKPEDRIGNSKCFEFCKK